eukprot:3434694-Lingulodinium_polyedra.AAC.1
MATPSVPRHMQLARSNGSRSAPAARSHWTGWPCPPAARKAEARAAPCNLPCPTWPLRLRC